MKGIYLDNSTTARPSPRAVSAMLPFLSDFWGAPSAPHQVGNMLMANIESSYRAIYQFLGASEEDAFVLTSSGSEAVNQVFHSVYQECTRRLGKTQYVVCSTDEAPALMCVSRLSDHGCEGSMLAPMKSGLVSLEEVEKILTPNTALLSLSWGNGMTGVLQPVQEIGELCKKKRVLFHLDVTHALGKTSFDFREMAVDFITFNGEQFHAPRGTGGVLFRKGAPAFPLIVGGIEQGTLHAGNLNAAALTALAEACIEGGDHRDYLGTETARLRNKLEDSVKAAIPEAQLFFTESERLPHIAVIGFPKIVNETLLYLLNKRKVFACIGGGSFQQIALVMEACGIESAVAHSCLSFSLSRDTTEEEIDETVQHLTEVLTNR